MRGKWTHTLRVHRPHRHVLTARGRRGWPIQRRVHAVLVVTYFLANHRLRAPACLRQSLARLLPHLIVSHARWAQPRPSAVRRGARRLRPAPRAVPGAFFTSSGRHSCSQRGRCRGMQSAAAPAPRIECTLLRCAAFVAVQLFFVGNTRSCTIRDAGCPPLCSVQRCNKGVGVRQQRVVKHTSSASTRSCRSLRINFAVNQCL